MVNILAQGRTCGTIAPVLTGAASVALPNHLATSTLSQSQTFFLASRLHSARDSELLAGLLLKVGQILRSMGFVHPFDEKPLPKILVERLQHSYLCRASPTSPGPGSHLGGCSCLLEHMLLKPLAWHLIHVNAFLGQIECHYWLAG